MSKELKILDLFSGVGTFSYAFESESTEKIKFKTELFCEMDKDCHKVLTRHWPEVPIQEDVKTLSGLGLKGKVDIIVGGFPCTDISVAGKQRGLVDEKGRPTRSGLWFEYKRLIFEIQPRWVVIENVRQLLNNGMLQILTDLDSLGYDCEWQIISARDIGQCHLRERVWILAWIR